MPPGTLHAWLLNQKATGSQDENVSLRRWRRVTGAEQIGSGFEPKKNTAAEDSHLTDRDGKLHTEEVVSGRQVREHTRS